MPLWHALYLGGYKKGQSGIVPSMGEDQITNGAFAADSGWVKQSDWTIAAGVATKAAGNIHTIAQGASYLVPGGLYQIVWTITTHNAGNFRSQFFGGTQVDGPDYATAATNTDLLRAATGNITFRIRSDAAGDGSVDNISLRRIA